MRHYLGNLGDGDSVDDVYVAADKQLRNNRNGQPFIQFDLRDRTGSMVGRMWNVGEAQFRTFEAGDYIKVRGKVQLFNNALQMIITAFERVEPVGLNLEDFLPQANVETGKLLERLWTILFTVKDRHLKALVQAYRIDDEFVSEFSACPAGVKNHHAYLGGLLEHVVTLLEAADRLSPLYPAVDRDLWLMGLFLHDVGKIRELGFKQTFSYTDAGQLVGHLVQGVQMLDEKIAKAAELTGESFPRELYLRLAHIIVSHHGEYEFGSPKLPMTLEAVAVNVLDNLDAKLHQVARELKDDRGAGAWTQFNPSLNRRFFKGGAGEE